jgi:hypothetical protein
MIKIVKLITGEELIADVTVVASGTALQLNKPCALQMVPSRTNPEQPMMGMFPYASYSEEHSIVVDNSNVVWSSLPVKELYNQYNSAFGSGIQLAGL